MKNSTYFDFRPQQQQGLLGGYNMQPAEDQWMSNNPIFNPQQQQPQFDQGMDSGNAWGQPNMQPIENQWMGNNPLADQMNKTPPAMDMAMKPPADDSNNDLNIKHQERMNQIREMQARQNLSGQAGAMQAGMGSYKDMSQMPAMQPRQNRTGQQQYANFMPQQENSLKSMYGLLGI